MKAIVFSAFTVLFQVVFCMFYSYFIPFLSPNFII